MKIFTHNFNPNSNSGPNKFSRQLFRQLTKDMGVVVESNQLDADIEFCLIQQQSLKVKPMVLRLDGIYFNSDQDYNRQNSPIKFAYDNSDSVIFQSEFNKKLTEKWFGEHKKGVVIHNAPDTDFIKKTKKVVFENDQLDNSEIWVCASSWRPHKRLKENIRYFLNFAPKSAFLIVAGSGYTLQDLEDFKGEISKRIFLTGEIGYDQLIGIYKKATTLVHLAYLDHCPNVVVDAQEAGCKIICSSTGGTSEIVNNGIIVYEKEWDMEPTKLYEPPVINFNNQIQKNVKTKNTLLECARKYYDVFSEVK